jgi:nickel transport protein
MRARVLGVGMSSLNFPPSVAAHDLWVEWGGDEYVLLDGHRRSGHAGEERVAHEPRDVMRASCLGLSGERQAVTPAADHPVRLPGPCAAVQMELSSGYWTKTPFGTKHLPRSQAKSPLRRWLCVETVLAVIRPVLWALGVLTAVPVFGHELRHQVSDTEAVVARFIYADDSPFSYESYELYRAGESVPFQVGRTDAHGRVVFVPDAGGEWRLKVQSEDGHGEDIRLTTGRPGERTSAEQPFFDRHARTLTGVGLLFGFFGLMSLFYRGRRR